MFWYLRAQAHTFTSRFAEGMLTAGHYTFAPQSNTIAKHPAQPLPIKAPHGLFQQDLPAISAFDSESDND